MSEQECEPESSEPKRRDSTAAVLAEVGDERDRQEAIWGEQNHDPFTYLAIATEELGEAAQAALKARYEGGRTWADYREELIQAAAVAVAAVECLDRGKWRRRDAVALPRVVAERQAAMLERAAGDEDVCLEGSPLHAMLTEVAETLREAAAERFDRGEGTDA